MSSHEDPLPENSQKQSATELTLSLLCKSLFSHNPDGILCYDSSLKITAWNDSMALITGIEKEKAIGTPLTETLPTFNDSSLLECFRLGLEGKASILPHSTIHSYPYEKSVALSGNCIPLLNDYEKVIGGIVTLHPHETAAQNAQTGTLDTEEKEEALQELRKESEQLATMGSWENNLLDKVITWSDNMYVLFDIPKEYPLEPELLTQFIVPEDLPLVNKSIEDLLSYPNQSIFHSYRIKTAKGELKYLEGHIRSFVNDNGEVFKFKGYVRDVTNETERKNILREVLNSSLDGVAAFNKVVDENGDVIDFTYQLINKQGCISIGRSEQEVLGKRLLTLFPAVKDLGLFDIYVRVLKTGVIEETETYYPFDGLNHWLKIIAAPLENGIVITFSDITRQIDNERKIIEQRHSLLEMQQLAQMGQFEWDAASNDLYWTDTQYEIFEFDKYKTNLTRTLFYKHIHQADLPLLKQAVRKCCKEHSIQSFEYRIITPKKTVKYLKGQFKPIVVLGKLQKLIGYCQDITELKVAEITQRETNLLLQDAQLNLQTANAFLEEKIEDRTKELAQKNQELEKLLKEFNFVTDFMPQIVWATSSEGRNDFLNKRWFDYTGASASNDFNITRDSILHPEDSEAIGLSWEIAQKQKTPFEAEGRMQRHDGEYRWFLMRSLPLKNEKGEIIKWYGTSTDIHDQKMALENLTQAREELKETNQELRKKNEQLQRVNNDLDNFIYTASHDLKAPISNIEGLIDALSDHCEEDQNMKEIIGMIDTSINRFKITLGDLTDIAKASNTDLNETESLAIQELITEIKSDIKPLIDTNKASILEDLAINKLNFSRKNLRSILYNLISNAVKYRSPDRNPLVIISTWAEDDNIVISVEDNGLGIKENDKAKVFMMFKRLHTNVEGSGVGMYIVKKIVEHAGGKIIIESELNKGTQFKVYLPLFNQT